MTTPEPEYRDTPPPVDPYAPVDYPEPAAGYPPPAYPPPPGGYGYPPPYSDPYREYSGTTGTNGLAVASLSTSLVGAVMSLLCCVLGIVPLTGIALGIVALGQIRRTHQSGRGLAVAGIVIGAVALLVSTAIVVLAAVYGGLDYSEF